MSGDHVRCLSWWTRSSYLAMKHVCRFSRWNSFVDSRGEHVRRFSWCTRSSSLAVLTRSSFLELEVFFFSLQVLCALYCRCCVHCTGEFTWRVVWSLAWRPFCLLPWRFNKIFFGQVRMHVCVHLHMGFWSAETDLNLSETHTSPCTLPLHVAPCTRMDTGAVHCKCQDYRCLVVWFAVHEPDEWTTYFTLHTATAYCTLRPNTHRRSALQVPGL